MAPLHGKSGPHDPAASPKGLTAYTSVMAKIFTDMGYAMHEDQNGPRADGVFSPRSTSIRTTRAAVRRWAHLPPEVRKRPNLTVLTESPLAW
jgi:hypothetical protein